MTRQAKKNWERIFAEQASKLLGKQWRIISSGEQPDFTILEGDTVFGLEVSGLFKVKPENFQYNLQQTESYNQKKLDELKHEFEVVTPNTPLVVNIVGDLEKHHDAVLPALNEAQFSTKEWGHHAVLNPIPELRIHATRATYSRWENVHDKIGFVLKDTKNIVLERVLKKSKLLPQYQKHAGRDVRLLLVANHMRSSGMLELSETKLLDTHGFTWIYLLEYPSMATAISGC